MFRGLISLTQVIFLSRRYRRIIGQVYLNDTQTSVMACHPDCERSVSFRMVRQGWARQFLLYSHDPKLAAAERQALGERVGMWAGDLVVKGNESASAEGRER